MFFTILKNQIKVFLKMIYLTKDLTKGLGYFLISSLAASIETDGYFDTTIFSIFRHKSYSFKYLATLNISTRQELGLVCKSICDPLIIFKQHSIPNGVSTVGRISSIPQQNSDLRTASFRVGDCINIRGAQQNLEWVKLFAVGNFDFKPDSGLIYVDTQA